MGQSSLPISLVRFGGAGVTEGAGMAVGIGVGNVAAVGVLATSEVSLLEQATARAMMTITPNEIAARARPCSLVCIMLET